MLPILTTLLLTESVWAAPLQPPPVAMEVVADQLATAPGTDIQILAMLNVPEGWHIYWQNPGDSGQATQISIQSNQSIETQAPQWTAPEEALELEGGVINYAYTHQAGAIIAVHTKEQAQGLLNLELVADYLICKHACVPGQVREALTLPISTQPHVSPYTEQIAQWTARLPKPLPEDHSSGWQNANFRLLLPTGGHGQLFPSEELETVLESIAWDTQGVGLEMTLQLKSNPTQSLTGSVLRISQAGGLWVDYELTVNPPESP